MRLQQRLYLTGHMGERKPHMPTSGLVHSQLSLKVLHSRPRSLLCICTYSHPLPLALPARAGCACRLYVYLHHQASHFNSQVSLFVSHRHLQEWRGEGTEDPFPLLASTVSLPLPQGPQSMSELGVLWSSQDGEMMVHFLCSWLGVMNRGEQAPSPVLASCLYYPVNY